MTYFAGAIPDRPFLVYTRERGWCVAVPVGDKSGVPAVVAYTRPGGAMIERRKILAVADLPPAPEGAL